MADENIRVVIEGDAGDLRAALRGAATDLRGFGSTTTAEGRRVSAFSGILSQQQKNLAGLRTGIRYTGLALSAGLAAGFVDAVRTGADFEQQMARVQGVTGATGDQLDKLSNLAIDLGAKTKFSAGEAAEGLYELSSAGFSVRQETAAIPGVMSLAAASNIDLADASEISSNALRGFGLAADQSRHVADVLAQSVNSSSVEMTDLQLSLKYIGPIAKSTGQSLETMIAAVSIMGDAGIKGEQAGTTLRAALLSLTHPVGQAIDGLRNLGLEASDLQGPNGLLPLPEIVAKLQAGTEGLSKAEQNAALSMIFGNEAASGMFAVIDQGPRRLQALTREFENSDGASKKAADTMNDTVSGAFDQLTGSIDTVEIALFRRFQEPLKEVLLNATDLVNTEGKAIGDFFESLQFDVAFRDGDFETKLHEFISQLKQSDVGDAVMEALGGADGESLGEIISALLDEAIPVVAAGAGHLAWEAVKAFVSAFIEADPWTQLVMGSWLLTKIGGGAAWVGIGRFLAGKVTAGAAEGLAASTISTGAGEVFGTQAAGGATRSMAKSMGASLLRGGLIGGAIYGGFQALFTDGGVVDDVKGWFGLAGDDAAQSFGDAFVQQAQPQMQEDISRLAQGLRVKSSDLSDLLMSIPKFNLFGTDNFNLDRDFSGGRGQKLEGISQQITDVRELAESYGDLTDEQEAAFDALQQSADEASSKFHASVTDIKQDIDFFSDGTGASLGDINTQIKKVSGEIAETLGADSARGRRQLGRNYREAVSNIREAMDRGEIGTKRGLARIRELMREARLVDPGKKDPFRIAEGFADSWKQAGKINKAGLKDIKDDLKKMPEDARDSAAKAMIDMAKSLEDRGRLPKGSTRKLVSYLQSTFDDLNTGPNGIPGIVADLVGKTGGFFDDLGSTVDSTLGGVISDLNDTLSQMGLDPVGVGVEKSSGGSGGGKPNRKQRGGKLSGGPSVGDHIPLLAENGEYMLNRQAVERIGVPTLDRLNFGLAPRFQEGGVIQQALGPYTMPPIQYDPNHAGGNSHVHLDFFTAAQALAYGHKMQGMGWSIGEYTPTSGNPWGFGGISASHQSPGHYDGTAFDANTPEDETESQVAAVARLVGGAGGMVGAVAEQVARRILTGPDGPPLDIGQAAIDKATKGANQYITEHMPTGTDGGGSAPYISGGDGAVAAQMGTILLRQGFDRAAAAGIIGNAYRESLWNPASVGTGGGGLFGFTTSPISLADLHAFADSQGKPWTDVGLQMQFMLMHGGLGMRGPLNALNSPEQAAALFMTEWERPGIPALDERQMAARQAFNMKGWQRGGLIDLDGAMHNMFGANSGDRRDRVTHRMQKDLKDLATEGLPLGNSGEIGGRLKNLREMADRFQAYAEAASANTDDIDGAATGVSRLGDVTKITAGMKDRLGIEGLSNGKEIVDGSEQFWQLQQLDALFKLRNLLISAEKKIDRRRKYAMKLLEAAREQAKEWAKKQRQAQHDLAKEGETPKDWKGTDPSKDPIGEWNKLGDKKRAELRAKFEKQGGRLPGDRAWGEDNSILTPEKQPNAFPNLKGIRSVLTLLNETVIPGLTGSDGDIGRLTTSRGSILTELETVQGPISDHRRRKKLPPLGTLLGDIGTLQDTLHDWGVSTDSISDDSSDGERADLAEQLLLQSQQENRLLSAGFGVFDGFFAELRGDMPYVGTYDHGSRGIPETGFAKVHKGEWITPAPDGPYRNSAAEAAAGGTPVIQLTLADNAGQLVKLIDARVDGKKADVAVSTDKRLGRQGRQRAFAPGR